MLIKQDGNLRKRHYTHTYIYICAVYITYMYMYMHIRCKRGDLGSADDDIAFFLHIHILSFLVIMYFFADHENDFCKYLRILRIQYTILHFSAYHDSAYCSWKDLFAIYMHILHICSTSKRRDGRKCAKHFA